MGDEKPLSEPMKVVLVAIANDKSPAAFYPKGQLRLIINALFIRGLIKRSLHDENVWKLRPAGRNIITRMGDEAWEIGTRIKLLV
jgi:hypothetical protein